MAEDKELSALIHLLDDDDKEVFKHVHDKLKSLGPDVIPALEEVWGAGLSPVTHDRLEEIIHEIQYESLTLDFECWVKDDAYALLHGAYLLARFHYPDLKYEEVQKAVTKIRQTIWLELSPNQTPLEQIQIFNQVFYNHHGFKGLQTYDSYQDFCVNKVIESKQGNSIIIGIIYQVIANDLGLPVYGVNLNRHYVLAFCKRAILDFNEYQQNGLDIMFYINPVNKGSVFSRNEIKDYLDKMHLDHDPKYFNPSDHKGIIKELGGYLLDYYTQENDLQKTAEMELLMKLI
ncbi:MAG TPA: transglutaminase family protein [Chitinophagales bacterium]|nr:transglutaminase family protein [Chitinophagales bacterium]